MTKIASCQYCNKEFKIKPGTYGKFCTLSCGTSFRNQQQKVLKITEYNLNPELCICCKIPLPYERRNNTYCSHSCSAKISNATRKRIKKPKKQKLFCKVKFVLCNKTNKWYSNRNPDGTVRRQSPYVKTDKEKYYIAAKFKFNVYDYPDKFDIKLIEKHGWYTCPGRKRRNFIKNTDGVSRDHMVSINYGFKNNVDPSIISHPANCRIVLHSENKKKSVDCYITIEELLKRIKEW